MDLRWTILIAEDSEDDRELLALGLTGAKLPFLFEFVGDGCEAMDYLQGTGKYADRTCYPLPWLLITDIKMPRVDGLELLSWVRTEASWQKMPAIVYSSSVRDGDRNAAMGLGAAAYVVKDVVFPPLELVQAIKDCAVLHPGLPGVRAC